MPLTNYTKDEILTYFRNHCDNIISDSELSKYNYKRQADIINNSLNVAKRELLSKVDNLESSLLITYCNFIAMLEYRHIVWNYDYISFARRIGEFWEIFCKIPFEYLSEIVEPVSFEILKNNHMDEYHGLLEQVPSEIKNELKEKYNMVWDILTAGKNSLTMDLHIKKDNFNYIIDFKSGFGSNEKGNTNRLQTIAKLYQTLNENYQCLIFVRDSGGGSNYLKQISTSKLWECYIGADCYNKIENLSGYDLKKWINENISWESDMRPSIYDFFKNNYYIKCLEW
jgi:hypothetical protein